MKALEKRRQFLKRLPLLATVLGGGAGVDQLLAAGKIHDPKGSTLGSIPFFGDRKALYSSQYTAIWYKPSKFVLNDARVRVHFLSDVSKQNGQWVGKRDAGPTQLGVSRVEGEEQSTWMQANPLNLPMLIGVPWQVYYSRRLVFQPSGRVIGPKAGFVLDLPGSGARAWAYVDKSNKPQKRTLAGFVICYTSHGVLVYPLPDMPPNKAPLMPCKAKN